MNFQLKDHNRLGFLSVIHKRTEWINCLISRGTKPQSRATRLVTRLVIPLLIGFVPNLVARDWNTTRFNLFLMLIVFSFCSCSLKKIENDLTKSNLKERVKTITESYYSVTDDTLEIQKTGLTAKIVHNYNETGNLTEKKEYDADGNLSLKEIYKYNSSGRLQERYGFDSNDNIKFNSVFIYDKKGKLNEIFRFNPDRVLTHKSEFRHFRKGIQIGLYTFKEDSSILNLIVYKYDRKGNLIETDQLNPKFNYKSKYTYETRDKGKILVRSEYNAFDILTKQWINKFDKKANLIELNTIDIERRTVVNESFKYEYDSKNNWIRKEIFKNDLPVRLIERKIEYF